MPRWPIFGRLPSVSPLSCTHTQSPPSLLVILRHAAIRDAISSSSTFHGFAHFSVRSRSRRSGVNDIPPPPAAANTHAILASCHSRHAQRLNAESLSLFAISSAAPMSSRSFHGNCISKGARSHYSLWRGPRKRCSSKRADWKEREREREREREDRSEATLSMFNLTAGGYREEEEEQEEAGGRQAGLLSRRATENGPYLRCLASPGPAGPSFFLPPFLESLLLLVYAIQFSGAATVSKLTFPNWSACAPSRPRCLSLFVRLIRLKQGRASQWSEQLYCIPYNSNEDPNGLQTPPAPEREEDSFEM